MKIINISIRIAPPRASPVPGSYADAKDDVARRFYERESFLPLSGQPFRLFRPMADIAALFR